MAEQGRDLVFQPIGHYHGAPLPKQGVPRQSLLENCSEGEIHLIPGQNFETALRDLDGFQRLWILFVFDRNNHWRPTTRPPIPHPTKDRIGVFASRGPYRPNPIGLSCVELISITGRVLKIAGADLLDQTPILDIKPYIPHFDSHPHSAIGWMESQDRVLWSVSASILASQQMQLILDWGGPDLFTVAKVQLEYDPFNPAGKRVQWNNEFSGILSIRTWDLQIVANPIQKVIQIESIQSRYTISELIDPNDIYNDKSIHIRFTKNFHS